jgi:hypothetical protein
MSDNPAATNVQQGREPLKPEHVRVLIKIFDEFCENDQLQYYKRKHKLYEKAQLEVTGLRAFCALLAGLGSALVFFVSPQLQGNTDGKGVLIMIAIVGVAFSIIGPALAAAFSTVSDLYQWRRFSEVFRDAWKSMERANGEEPVRPSSDALVLRAQLDRYVNTTLAVMEDETKQFGQFLRSPEDIEKFVKQAEERVERLKAAAEEA